MKNAHSRSRMLWGVSQYPSTIWTGGLKYYEKFFFFLLCFIVFICLGFYIVFLHFRFRSFLFV